MKVNSRILATLMPLATFVIYALGEHTSETLLVQRQDQRELFFSKNNGLTNCVKNELLDFNVMFDARSYRDKILAEADLTLDQLKRAQRRNRNTFQQSPENLALMEAIGARQAELEEVAQIVYACQEEMNGGSSAAGTGAMVGTLLAQAMENGPLDRALTINAEQAPTAAPFPSSSPSASPTTNEEIFPIFLGTHSEIDCLILQGSESNFLGNITSRCYGLTTGLFGYELSIAITVALGIPNSAYHKNSNMYGVDVGLGVHVGLMAGGFVESSQDATCNGPALIEITIGTGLSLPSIEATQCTWFYRVD